MDKHLSPDTEAALRKLAREVGAARGLDDDAREELFGHLEDKTLGYLSGDESLSEADAVLLTREHFGDSARLSEMLPSPHGSTKRISMTQRLVMVACVTFAFGALLQRTAMSLIGVILGFEPPQPIAYVLIVLLCSGVVTWSLAVAAGLVLRWWERHAMAGTAFRIDLSKSKHLSIVMGVAALMLLSIVTPFSPPFKTSSMTQGISQTLVDSLSWLFVASTVAWPLLWVWWFDRRSGRVKAMVAGAATWIGFRLMLSLLPVVVSVAVRGPQGVTISRSLMMLPNRMLVMYLPTLLVQAGVAFALYLLYAAWRDGVRILPVKAKPAVR